MGQKGKARSYTFFSSSQCIPKENKRFDFNNTRRQSLHHSSSHLISGWRGNLSRIWNHSELQLVIYSTIIIPISFVLSCQWKILYLYKIFPKKFSFSIAAFHNLMVPRKRAKCSKEVYSLTVFYPLLINPVSESGGAQLEVQNLIWDVNQLRNHKAMMVDWRFSWKYIFKLSS